jgi:hypothetical protein
LWVFAVCIAWSCGAYAEAARASEPPAQNTAAALVAFEPALVAKLRYARLIAARPAGLHLHAGAMLTLPVLPLDRARGRVALIARGEYAHDEFELSTELLPFVLRDANEAGDFTALGVELRVLPAWRPSWGALGFDVSWQMNIATHVQHSARIRDTFGERYPPGVQGITGPRNGWYGWMAHRLRMGVASHYRVSQRWTLQSSFGVLLAPQPQGVQASASLGQVPLYLEFGADVQW